LADQLKWGLIGVVLSITLLAWVLSRFIPRVPAPRASEQAGETAA
jgi:flagellar biogenesis protein FliO